MGSSHLYYFVSFETFSILIFLSLLLSLPVQISLSSNPSDENLMHLSTNVNGACKILILKFSVGLIVIQNLIEEILYATGTLDIQANDRYNSEQRAERALCMSFPTFPPSLPPSLVRHDSWSRYCCPH